MDLTIFAKFTILFFAASFVYMKGKREGTNLKLLKIFLAVIAIVSLMFVLYNISVYTNDSNMEVFAEGSLQAF